MRAFAANLLLQSLKATVQRFPLTIGFAIAQTFMWLLTTFEVDLDYGHQVGIRLTLFTSLGLLYSTAVALRAESLAMPAADTAAAYGAGLIGLLIYAAWLPNPGDLQILGTLGFLVPALVLLIMVAPVLGGDVTNDQAWLHNQTFGFAAAFGFLGATILIIGIGAAFGALDFLLGVDIDGILYGTCAILAYSLLWPWLTLANLPRPDATASSITLSPQHLFIVKRILVPLAVLYFAILYAYIGKIIIEWSLPKGGVAYLVGGYAGYGVIVHLLAYPARETGGALIRVFYKVFWFALIPPLALLIIGTATRINAYGLTENRYALVVLAVWLAASIIYSLIVRRPRLILVPAGLAVLLAIASFGPWGASMLSTANQLNRLESLLTRHQLLVDGRIVPATTNPPIEDVKAIGGIITYFLSRGKTRELAPWYASTDVDFDRYPGHSELMSAINLDYIPQGAEYASFSFYTNYQEPVNVRGYDFLWRKSASLGDRTWTEQLFLGDDRQPYSLFFDPTLSLLSIRADDSDAVTMELEQMITDLRTAGQQQADPSAMVLTAESADGRLRVKLQFTHINGTVRDDEPRVDYVDFQLMIADRDRP